MTSALHFIESNGNQGLGGFMKSLEQDGGEAKKPSTNNCENEEYVVSKSSKTEGFRLVKDHQLPNAPLIMDFKEEPNVLNSKMKTFDGAIDIIAKNPYFCVKTYTPDNLKHWLDVMKNVKVIHKKLKIHVPFLQDKVSAEQEQLVHIMVDRIEATGADADKKKSVNIRFCGLGGESGTLSLVIASANGDILMDFEMAKSDKKMLHKQFVQLVKILKNRKLVVIMSLKWSDGQDNLKLDDFFAQMGWPAFGEKMCAILKKPESFQYQYKKDQACFDVKDVITHGYTVDSKFASDNNVYSFST